MGCTSSGRPPIVQLMNGDLVALLSVESLLQLEETLYVHSGVLRFVAYEVAIYQLNDRRPTTPKAPGVQEPLVLLASLAKDW